MGLGRVKKVWGKMAARIAGLTAAAAAIALALGPARAAQPSLTPAQVVALFGAAGFPRGPNKRPVNRRRQPANPKVSFVDMNGDGQLEALFIDEGPYYKPDGRWYAVAAQSPGGAWRILEGEGSLHATGAASRGWFVLAATGAGRTKELRYDGHVYASADHAPGAALRRRIAPPPSRAGRRCCAGRGRGGRAQGRPLSDGRMESARQVRAAVAGRAGLDHDRRGL